jgi:hypothetical protein
VNIHQLTGPPSPDLAKALREFESNFAYPLGPGKWFRISHGEDYGLFFRAQGNSSCFIAEDKDGIIGVIGTAIRKLGMPDGTERSAAYFGDLKIAKRARGGRGLLRLARAAEAWLRPQVQVAFGVAMEGTFPTPDLYTGRSGIPPFVNVGRIMVLRFGSCAKDESFDLEPFVVTVEKGLETFRGLSFGHYSCAVFQAGLRSQVAPCWLRHPEGTACGLLEDTRKAKRLIQDDGVEMISAHLSCFAWSSARAGVQLLQAARLKARTLGLDALFVSMAEKDYEKFRKHLLHSEPVIAPATIYGAGLTPDNWNINSSEI